MVLIILAVLDKKAGYYGNPFTTQSLPAGIRSFTYEVNRQSPENMINLHPDDFDLYELGKFDNATGLWMAETPRIVCRASEVIKPIDALSVAPKLNDVRV